MQTEGTIDQAVRRLNAVIEKRTAMQARGDSVTPGEFLEWCRYALSEVDEILAPQLAARFRANAEPDIKAIEQLAAGK